MWQESRQRPRRLSPPAPSIRSAIWSKSRASRPLWPAVCSSSSRQESLSFRELAIVFADFSSKRSRAKHPVHVALDPGDELMREWMVVCDAPNMAACLIGWERPPSRGQRVFEQSGCAGCHTPPLYANNKLTPVQGFRVPDKLRETDQILDVSVGTDSGLAMKTRRGTGFYKVPSLRGVWYRNAFSHNGQAETLEEWFDPARLREDYVPLRAFISVPDRLRAMNLASSSRLKTETRLSPF